MSAADPHMRPARRAVELHRSPEDPPSPSRSSIEIAAEDSDLEIFTQELAFEELTEELGESQGERHRPRRVLIVEDEALIAMDLERRLMRLGYEVVGIADHEAQVMTLFEQTSPELILMDINLRRSIDGIEIAKRLKRLRDVPIIFVTAYNDEQTVQRAAQVSPYGYLLKPLDDRTLLVNLRLAFDKHDVDRRAKLYGAAMKAATVGIVIIERSSSLGTPHGLKLIYANDAYATMTGLSHPSDALSPLLEALHDPAQQGQALLHALLHGEHASAQLELRRDAEPFVGSIVVSPVQTVGESRRYMLMFITDVTRQHEAERALVENQRMELLGRLSAGIAHDFNNVLMAITAFAESAQYATTPEESTEDLAEVLHAAERGAQLTRKLLNLSRQDPVHASCELNQVIQSLKPMLQRLVGPTIQLHLQLDALPLPLACDATSIEQVLLNLTTNARDAMPQRGALTITATHVFSSAPTQPHAQLLVKDTGQGMDAQTRARIFEPFFTTKPKGLGTGLGLATVRQIVERMGGRVEVHSAPDQGTIFELRLPLKQELFDERPAHSADVSVDARADASARAQASPRPAQHTPTHPAHRVTQARAQGQLCLIVEDEPQLLEAFAKTLERAGFSVLKTSTQAGALRLLRERGSQLSLILSDMMLGQSSGLEVLAAADQLAPHASQIAITGYMNLSPSELPAQTQLLWKPCSSDTLTRAALRALHEQRGDLRQLPSMAMQRDSTTLDLPQRGAALLIDPDEQRRASLTSMLQSQSVHVLDAPTGTVALKLCDIYEFDLIITAASLHDVDGMTLLRALRGRFETTPILLLLNETLSPTHLDAALRERVVGVLSPPISPQDLRQELERALHESHVARIKHHQRAAAPTRAPHDQERLRGDLERALESLTLRMEPISRVMASGVYAYHAQIVSQELGLTHRQLDELAQLVDQRDQLCAAICEQLRRALDELLTRDELLFFDLDTPHLGDEALMRHMEPLGHEAHRVVLQLQQPSSPPSAQRQRHLDALRQAGYRLCVDGLGAMHSSMEWVVELAPDFVKLAPSITHDLPMHKLREEAVLSIIGFCRRNHITVIARSNQRQDIERLQDLGCALIQTPLTGGEQP